MAHFFGAKLAIAQAKKLLAEAGYPNGVSQKTGEPLVLHYDVAISGDPTENAQLAWFRKRFELLGIQLDIRGTQYNRFQEKMRLGNAQLFSWGWNADYPDPENFLFLLYGPNGKVKEGGENAANYSNPDYDQLFEQMKSMPNTPERLEIIKKMLDIAERDTPWVWGFYPKQFVLMHNWVRVSKPNALANNTLKYARIDPQLRAKEREQWNRPIWWPMMLIVILFVLALVPVVVNFIRREHRVRRKM